MYDDDGATTAFGIMGWRRVNYDTPLLHMRRDWMVYPSAWKASEAGFQ